MSLVRSGLVLKEFRDVSFVKFPETTQRKGSEDVDPSRQDEL